MIIVHQTEMLVHAFRASTPQKSNQVQLFCVRDVSFAWYRMHMGIYHRENGGTLGVVPLTPYTPYIAVFIGYIPFQGLLGGVKQLGYHPHASRKEIAGLIKVFNY